MVLAHEAAHVHSDHVLYRTALVILMRLGTSVRLPILAGLPLMAIHVRAAGVVARGRAVAATAPPPWSRATRRPCAAR